MTQKRMKNIEVITMYSSVVCTVQKKIKHNLINLHVWRQAKSPCFSFTIWLVFKQSMTSNIISLEKFQMLCFLKFISKILYVGNFTAYKRGSKVKVLQFLVHDWRILEMRIHDRQHSLLMEIFPWWLLHRHGSINHQD